MNTKNANVWLPFVRCSHTFSWSRVIVRRRTGRRRVGINDEKSLLEQSLCRTCSHSAAKNINPAWENLSLIAWSKYSKYDVHHRAGNTFSYLINDTCKDVLWLTFPICVVYQTSRLPVEISRVARVSFPCVDGPFRSRIYHSSDVQKNLLPEENLCLMEMLLVRCKQC